MRLLAKNKFWLMFCQIYMYIIYKELNAELLFKFKEISNDGGNGY